MVRKAASTLLLFLPALHSWNVLSAGGHLNSGIPQRVLSTPQVGRSTGALRALRASEGEADELDALSMARLALQAAIQVEDYAEAARLKKEIEASEERTVVEEQEDGLSAEPSSATTAELTPGRPLGLASCPSAHELWAGGAESAQRDSILVFPGLATKAECAALVEASTAAAAGHREACLASSVPCSGYVRLLTAAAAKRALDGSPTSGETVQLMLRPRRYALEPPTLCAASDATCEAILLRLLSLLDAEMPSLVLDHFGAGWPLGLRELYEVS